MATSSVFSIAEQSIHFLTRRHDGPATAPIGGPAAWFGRDLRDQTDRWLVPVDPEVLVEVEKAASRIGEVDDLARITEADLDTPLLAAFAAELRTELEHGLGFRIVRGVPVERWDPATQRLFLWALARHLGVPGVQNPRGDLIGEVRDTQADAVDPNARNYATNKEFRFHCDAADVVGLLCIRQAASGGRSRVASSVTVFNELLRSRPELAARLFEPVLLDARNEQAAGLPPYAPVVPLAHAGGALRTFYIADYFRSVERFDEVTLDPLTRELFDAYEETAGREDVCLELLLQPGDLQLLYNHSMLHARTAFEDSPDESGRLLLRILVSLNA